MPFMEKDVAKHPYLHQPKDRSGWVFRVVIPLRLRAYTKPRRREFKETLGPTYQAAMERYHQALATWLQLRQSLEESARADGPAIDDNYIPPVTYKYLTARQRRLLDHFVDSWVYRSAEAHDVQVPSIAANDEARQSTGEETSFNELDEFEQDLKNELAELKGAMRRMQLPESWVEDKMSELGEVTGILLHPECAERNDFLFRLAAADIEALELSLGRLSGNKFRPTPPKPAGPFDDEDRTASGPTLLDAFTMWSNQRTRAGGGKTDNEYRAFAERFALFALDAPLERAPLATLAALTRERQIGRRWLEHVANSQGVQRKTLRKYRSAVSTLFAVAIDNGMTDVNPFSFKLTSLQLRGTTAEKSKGNKESRSPLPPSVMDTFFSGPLYDGPGFDRRLLPPVAYWLPLLLRFTGARPLELAFLMRDDIVLAEDGATEASQLAGHGDASWIYIFSDIRGVGDVARPVKTGVSLRRFPVPRILLDLGFADYVRSIPRGQWLLPMQFPVEKPQNRAVYALNALGDYRKTTLGILDSQYVTYSFRHTVIDEAREAGIAQEVRDNLVGHTEGDNRDKNAGEIYYGARWYPAKPLLEAVAELNLVMHRLPPNFPTWAEFQRRTPDFSNVARSPKAPPLKKPRRNT